WLYASSHCWTISALITIVLSPLGCFCFLFLVSTSQCSIEEADVEASHNYHSLAKFVLQLIYMLAATNTRANIQYILLLKQVSSRWNVAPRIKERSECSRNKRIDITNVKSSFEQYR